MMHLSSPTTRIPVEPPFRHACPDLGSENNPELSDSAREAIVDEDNLVFVSAVSIWEINVKQAMGNLDVPDNLIEEIQIHSFTPLEIKVQHAHLAGRPPAIHKDPFDRMLIAQSILEKLTIVTWDQIINQYEVTVLYAEA